MIKSRTNPHGEILIITDLMDYYLRAEVGGGDKWCSSRRNREKGKAPAVKAGADQIMG
jgi:hypothetical protein